MGQQYKLGAIPLFLRCWDFLLPKRKQYSFVQLKPSDWRTYILYFVFIEVWNVVDNHPGQRAAKVHGLMHQERHDACCEDIILHIGIPCCP